MEQERRYIIDRVGEETSLEECALCYSASCFSCVSDHCIALEKLSDSGCAFYKDYEENHKEILRCFYRLIRCQRFDLLTKYADTLAALGLMDHEIAMAEKRAWAAGRTQADASKGTDRSELEGQPGSRLSKEGRGRT